MKKGIKKLLAIALAFVMTVLVMVPVNVKADSTVTSNNTIGTQDTLKLDGNWKNYYLNENKTDYIKIVVPSKGRLTLTYTMFCGSNYYEFLNEDFAYINNTSRSDFRNFVYASESSPKTNEVKLDLNKGIYYARFTYMNDPGRYRIKADFQAVSADEKEPNDTYDKANKISLEKYVKGYITEQDDVDYYKIHISKSSDYKFLWHSENGNGRFSLYDDDLNRIIDKWIYDKNRTYSEIQYLKAGDYYISWKKENGTGTYQFKAMLKLPAKLNTTKVTLLKGKSKKLTVANNENTPSFSSSNYAVAYVESNGNVKARRYGKATITAYVDGKQLTCKVQVADPKLNKTSISLKKKKSYTLKVSQRFGKITWKTSKSSVASVKNGKITAKKKGTAYIYASCDGRNMKCKVTVK